MGRRFIHARYQIDRYNDVGARRRLNSPRFALHHLRPYGLESMNFWYRQIFTKKHQSRQQNCAVKRAVKKAARQQAQRELQHEQRGGEEMAPRLLSFYC